MECGRSDCAAAFSTANVGWFPDYPLIGGFLGKADVRIYAAIRLLRGRQLPTTPVCFLAQKANLALLSRAACQNLLEDIVRI